MNFFFRSGPFEKYRLIQVPETLIAEVTKRSKYPRVLDCLGQTLSAVEKIDISIQVGHRESGDKLTYTRLNAAANGILKPERKMFLKSVLVMGFGVYRVIWPQ